MQVTKIARDSYIFFHYNTDRPHSGNSSDLSVVWQAICLHELSKVNKVRTVDRRNFFDHGFAGPIGTF